jgi:hypothetical protein
MHKKFMRELAPPHECLGLCNDDEDDKDDESDGQNKRKKISTID